MDAALFLVISDSHESPMASELILNLDFILTQFYSKNLTWNRLCLNLTPRDLSFNKNVQTRTIIEDQDVGVNVGTCTGFI